MLRQIIPKSLYSFSLLFYFSKHPKTPTELLTSQTTFNKKAAGQTEFFLVELSLFQIPTSFMYLAGQNRLMDNEIFLFISQYYGETSAQSLKLLNGGGSSRKYYRFYHNDKSFVLTKSENTSENKTFIYFTTHFSKVISNLPEIMQVNPTKTLYVQKDLGDTSLLDVLIQNPSVAKKYYRDAVLQLAEMQILGDADLDYTQCFSYPKFNHLIVLRDLFSFKNYFVNLIDLDFNHALLLEDFERFSNDFEQIQHQYFVIRDFQSRNIMIHKEEVYFIDYQGGLKGPIQYDLVSLLWQAKANLSDQWKTELLLLYTEKLESLIGKFNREEFQKAYDLCVIERLIQVLGTYGYRGIYERKAHFLESISYGINNIKQIIDCSILQEYPELHKVLFQLTTDTTQNKIKNIINAN